MKKLICTVGLPRSGKSTWAKEQNLPMVNPDSIRLGLYGEAFIKEAEQMVWSIATYMVKALFIAGHDTVILDATNLTIASRNRWLYHDWECEWKIFDTSKEECTRRAIASEREDLIHVIEMMDNHKDLTGTEEN
jgi:predicted kinase